MTVTCVVQARTGSTRLPGKVLADLGGRPMLGFMLDRLASLRVDDLVVATSDLDRDDPVAEVAAQRHVAVVRGSEADVLGRFALALDAYPADVVVRLTADCPLSDSGIIHAALDLRDETGADYASNSLVRTFPVGLDVEVVTATALRQAAAEASDPPEREHVMPFIYRRPERFRLRALRCPDLLGDERWTVDTTADLERVRHIVAALDDPVGAGWRDMLGVAGNATEAAAGEPGSVRMRPAVGSDGGTIAALSADPASVALGASDDGAPPPLTAAHLIDAGVRTWIMTGDEEEPVAWVEMSVRGGEGSLRGRSRPELADRVLGRLRRYLATDYQVRRLITERGGPAS